ncbi:MAG: DoxX family protein [Acidobacteriota bacterium]
MKEDRGITIIRFAVAILMCIHGVTRIFNGVAPFGEFLAAKGFPLGLVIAWSITIFEIAGAVLLILKRYVIPVAAVFILQLAMGIVLIHAQNGWFVVGAGRNGAEYSVLLIVAFLSLIVSARSSTVR